MRDVRMGIAGATGWAARMRGWNTALRIRRFMPPPGAGPLRPHTLSTEYSFQGQGRLSTISPGHLGWLCQVDCMRSGS